MLLDLLDACRDERDEQVLHQHLNGNTQEDIAGAVEMGQQWVSVRLRTIYRRAGVTELQADGLRSLRVRPGWRELAGGGPLHKRPSGMRFPPHTSHFRKTRCWCQADDDLPEEMAWQEMRLATEFAVTMKQAETGLLYEVNEEGEIVPMYSEEEATA